jgi:VanZ family protein
MIRHINFGLRKWAPAVVMMVVIFWYSSQPSSDLPNFDWADKVIKKGGHVFGYAMLAWSYWNALDRKPHRRWLAWLFAILYAVTDEYHQSFVTGRSPSVWDVVAFDNLGALLALGILASKQKKQTMGISNSENRDSLSLGSPE